MKWARDISVRNAAMNSLSHAVARESFIAAEIPWKSRSRVFKKFHFFHIMGVTISGSTG